MPGRHCRLWLLPSHSQPGYQSSSNSSSFIIQNALQISAGQAALVTEATLRDLQTSLTSASQQPGIVQQDPQERQHFGPPGYASTAFDRQKVGITASPLMCHQHCFSAMSVGNGCLHHVCACCRNLTAVMCLSTLQVRALHSFHSLILWLKGC